MSKNYVFGRIPGYDNHYIITGTGSIFGNRKVPFGRGIRELKTQVSNSGYEMVKLISGAGKNKLHTIHRLVALTFIPNPHNKSFVNHKDGNKLNNCAENLEWVSPCENLKHAYDTGLMSHKGEKNSRAKLKNSDIPVIRDRIKSGEMLKTIANDYGVHYSIISGIMYGKIWMHVD
jgi:hypothetical protein